jgi:3-dehydroquinate dehydratase-2
MKIMVLNGPNLNLLGKRQPEIYGTATLEDLAEKLQADAPGHQLEFRQSNNEGELIDWIQQCFQDRTAVILNPGAFTHYSYALHDACAMLSSAGIPLIEVHISNPHARDEFRRNSVISPVATGVIAGFGIDSYRLALRQLLAD